MRNEAPKQVDVIESYESGVTTYYLIPFEETHRIKEALDLRTPYTLGEYFALPLRDRDDADPSGMELIRGRIVNGQELAQIQKRTGPIPHRRLSVNEIKDEYRVLAVASSPIKPK